MTFVNEFFALLFPLRSLQYSALSEAWAPPAERCNVLIMGFLPSLVLPARTVGAAALPYPQDGEFGLGLAVQMDFLAQPPITRKP